tara:strand:- start:10971 stop:11861 length:891 start_codon:yes stop_codon:yes gene_type:complete
MNSQEQVSNALSGAPESSSNEEMDVDKFFEALDTQVNGSIYDNEPKVTNQSQTTSNELDNQDVQSEPTDMSPVEGQDTDIENLQKRYSDSSREAKKLSKQLKEIEPYMPILDAMKEDPNLISHVRGYFEGGGEAPSSMKEKLNLGEDFVFDPDEAMSNSNSDSARVLSATIDGVVQRRLNETMATQKQENTRLAKEIEFKQKHNLDDAQWSKFLEFARNKTLELDDIFYLMNKGKREQTIARNANQEVTNQMKKVQQKPASLASAGSSPEQEKTHEDMVFDAILGAENKLEKALGF